MRIKELAKEVFKKFEDWATVDYENYREDAHYYEGRTADWDEYCMHWIKKMREYLTEDLIKLEKEFEEKWK